MIADFAISLSRQKKDKVNGTGRFHIMKNRYGMDGLTFNAKVDTSTGHIEFLSQLHDDDDDDMPSSKPNKMSGDFDDLDKEYLAQQFFSLSNK
jgi:hypothetical protein